MSTQTVSHIDQFDRVTLPVLQEQLLMKRKENKFFFGVSQLPVLLEVLRPQFEILEVEGELEQQYFSYYFDTADLKHYTDHHNRRANRYKLRFRDYVGSKLSFFELKFKNNKGVTIKSRIPVPFESRKLDADVREFLKNTYVHDVDDLSSSISTKYKRLSLISKDRKARLTIDKDIEFIRKGAIHDNPGLIIMELKYSDEFDHNYYLKQFKLSGIYKSPISKYCTGIASHYKGVKKNLFLPTLRRISNITKQAIL